MIFQNIIFVPFGANLSHFGDKLATVVDIGLSIPLLIEDGIVVTVLFVNFSVYVTQFGPNLAILGCAVVFSL